MAEPDIHCPRCGWRPRLDSVWQCSRRLGGCGTRWNTFLTGGLCPTCACAWEITACPGCRQFSLHKDWYHERDPSPAPSERREIPEPATR